MVQQRFTIVSSFCLIERTTYDFMSSVFVPGKCCTTIFRIGYLPAFHILNNRVSNGNSFFFSVINSSISFSSKKSVLFLPRVSDFPFLQRETNFSIKLLASGILFNGSSSDWQLNPLNVLICSFFYDWQKLPFADVL